MPDVDARPGDRRAGSALDDLELEAQRDTGLALGDVGALLKVLAGRPEAGSKLSVRIAPPGVMAMTLAPRVLRADANREFRWLGSLLVPGIFDGEQFFQVEANGAGTRFRHGEHFRGLLVPLVMRGKMLAATRAGFAAFNADLKLRTEARR